MPRKLIFPDKNSKPSGFSPGVISGNVLFISGQVPVTAEGDIVGVGSCLEQARQCFSNIEQIVISAGATMDDLTKITALLVNPGDYPDYAKERLELFPDEGPASSTVFISGLVRSEFLIEIEAFAVLGD